jgi:hypothetical protein
MKTLLYSAELARTALDLGCLAACLKAPYCGRSQGNETDPQVQTISQSLSRLAGRTATF